MEIFNYIKKVPNPFIEVFFFVFLFLNFILFLNFT